jgi:hypothetical protein
LCLWVASGIALYPALQQSRGRVTALGSGRDGRDNLMM